MKAATCQDFQDTVGKFTIRHKSILDILCKTQEASVRVNRALTKAVTSCGCIQIKARKQCFPSDTSLEDIRDLLDNHLYGTLCENCREIVEREVGSLLFYTAALCNTLDLRLDEILAKENDKVSTLRVFNFT